MNRFNVYDDGQRAESYASLQFPGTYYLAYRDLPEIVREHVRGRRALDFGCGAGRSTRFVRSLGFEVVGVDISASMISCARRLDPSGDYRLVGDCDLGALQSGSFDLVLSMFTFDNIPTRQHKLRASREFVRVLRRAGHVLHVVSSPQLYLHDWASFQTSCFPENRTAHEGDTVRTVIVDTDDPRAVDDVLCPDDCYRELFADAGLRVSATYHPLATGTEPYAWVNETKIAPWTVYLLDHGDPALP